MFEKINYKLHEHQTERGGRRRKRFNNESKKHRDCKKVNESPKFKRWRNAFAIYIFAF